MKAKVVVGRKWDNPNITVVITKDEIGVSMDVKDFLHALSLEAGNPSMLLTVSALEKRLNLAADKVVSGMKKETAKVQQ